MTSQNMKILVFTEGTIIMHPSEDKINDYAAYVPIKDAVKKLNAWIEQGAEISYLTSRTKFGEIKAVSDVLKNFNFPTAVVRAKHGDETYQQIVEEIRPNILIEDDCASIGADEITTPKLNPELDIRGIVVPEFGGIDHLPDDLEDLKYFGVKEKSAEADEDEL